MQNRKEGEGGKEERPWGREKEKGGKERGGGEQAARCSLGEGRARGALSQASRGEERPLPTGRSWQLPKAQTFIAL